MGELCGVAEQKIGFVQSGSYAFVKSELRSHERSFCLKSPIVSVLSIHRLKRTGDAPQTRDVQMLNMEIQEIMKGVYPLPHFE